ncbi:MAG: hypothetical protein Kow0068_21040 [Marinilabiliales bacterium]
MITIYKYLSIALVLIFTNPVNDFNATNDNKIKAPQIISPVNNQYFLNDTCQFMWTSCGENVKYEVWLSKLYNFQSVSKATSKDTLLKKVFSQTEYGTYYWKVRAFNNKIHGEWSQIYCFHVGEIQQNNYYHGCSGNCATCPHPCGRRNYYNINKIKPQ